jgi:hypothetical protein
VLTRVTSVVFLIAGLGAGHAVFSSGDQTTPGHQYDRIILFALAFAFAIVGIALFLDFLWAWWSSVAIAAITVVIGRALRLEYGDLWPWAVVLGFLATSAVQGVRDTSKSR